MRGCVLATLIVFSAGVAGAQEPRLLTPDVRTHTLTVADASRLILVCLPPGYATDTGRRYPTLYMHDGSNVYVEWRIDEVAKRLIASNAIEPLIIVLVPNGGSAEDRFDDYTPTRPRQAKAGGRADAYGKVLVEELKPLIDATYRTRPDASSTALGGASLGGLVSLYLGLEYPAVFGNLAAVSPSVWWDDKLIVKAVKKLESKPATRIWLDIGTKESRPAIGDARELRDALVKKGWTVGGDLSYTEIDGGTHDERSFARRAEPFLKYLFPVR